MTEPVSQPIFVVDEDPSAVEALAGDLERRFRADYRVMGETSAQAALERLAALRDAGDEVALIICYESMRAMPGSELLARTRSAHPDAKRILLIDYGDQRMLQVIAHGMALGHVEYYLTKPWRPRQHLLCPVVGEALVAWTRLNSPGFELVRIVGDHWDPVSFELRDALERNRVPYRFYDRDSAEGAELLGQLDEVPDNPVIFLADGRVLTSYTRAEIAEAVGAPVRPKLDAYDLVVAGAGPAGLSAAVYGASEGLSTLVLESTAMGGQAGTSSRIRNFLGFPAGISGSELAERAFQQAWMFGAEFVFINGAARRLDVRLSKGTFAMSAARRAPDQLDMRPPSLHIYASWSCTENARSCRGQGRAPLARRGFSPKLLSRCVYIYALTCGNAEESQLFLHRKSATTTSYHDESLRWSDPVARRNDLQCVKAQVSAGVGVPPPSNFGLAMPPGLSPAVNSAGRG